MNSIFRKQFFLLTAGLVTSFLLLMIGLVQAFSTYSYRQKEEDMLSQAGVIEQVYNWSYNEGIVNYELFQNSLYEHSIGFEYSFVVLNDEYNFGWTVQNGKSDIDIDGIKQDVDFNSIFQGNNVVLHRTFLDVIKNKPYIVGYPIKHDDETVAAVLLNSSMEQIKATTYDSYRIIIIFMCLAIIINFVIIYYSSNKFAVPLKQMSEAAREIAGGDFEKRLNINTNDEIGDLATSFNAMAQSLFFQEKRRREFISNISHDLRSPLTSMRGFLQAILDGTIPPEKQNHYLQIVLDESERLAKMANDMLDINKLDDSQMGLNVRDFNLNELVDKTLRNFEDRGLQNKIKISSDFCNEGIVVRADPDKIQRVIYNLVDNAIKFTHKYGYIKVITEIKEKKVYISVKDNGKGISHEEQIQVFDRLYKGDKSRGKDKKGSGLGLSIVKEFVKAHKEEITLKSEVGKGSTFTFTLPLVNKGEPIRQES